ncbi:MAG: DUF2079 domain-containing protein [Actinobacteria bacterium]|nr:DUF2079 domain-containing protein [Actinomycetota bacterium]
MAELARQGWQWLGGRRRALAHQLATMHSAARLVALGVIVFAVVFGSLGVQNQRNFGTWSYDMGIYDQGIWLISRGEQFMSVRGMNFWGHHFNVIAYLFVPAYWLGAGPEFLYVVQALALALGAVPTYLIARDKLRSPWWGLLFAVVYLMYAPVQWISWAMFHPEALVITPFLFAWWFATRERWGWFFAMVLLALSTREDVALAVIMLGLVLAIYMRGAPDYRRILQRCGVTVVLAGVWYVVATKLVLPYFNDGKEPFYITYFYGNYGSDTPEILGTIIRHPNRVISDAVQHDRIVFYKQMSWPMGWVYLANPLGLLMALPQLLASVIGLSPYARIIKYQYTSVMIAPMIIASIHGAYTLSKLRALRAVLPIWLLLCSFTSNVAWSPSPLGEDVNYFVWSRDHPRHDSMRTALTFIPPDASVTASYQLLPHLSHRREIYDWPNPFWASVWGNDDCDHLPDPRSVEYVALDLTQIGANNQQLFDDMRKPGGPFEVIFSDDDAIVLHRIGTSAEVDVRPQAESCAILKARHLGG